MNKMRVKCIDTKGYLSITEGKEYDAEKHSEHSYTVKNNNNIKMLYNKSSFTTLEDDKKPKLSNEKKILDSLKYVGREGTIEIKLNKSNTIEIETYLNITTTHISCGIMEVFDIINQTKWILEYIPNIGDLQSNVFRKLIDIMLIDIEEENAEFLLFSTNTNLNKEVIDLINNTLDPISLSKHEGYNPNSGNPIALWTVKRSELLPV